MFISTWRWSFTLLSRICSSCDNLILGWGSFNTLRSSLLKFNRVRLYLSTNEMTVYICLWVSLIWTKIISSIKYQYCLMILIWIAIVSLSHSTPLYLSILVFVEIQFIFFEFPICFFDGCYLYKHYQFHHY
jgi:hypothetical protein